MSGAGIRRWFRVAFDDVILALSAVHRPWTDLGAVKTTQVDLVKAIAGQQSDVAAAQAAIATLSQEVSRLNGRVAEHEAAIRQLQSTVDLLQSKSRQG